MSDSQEPWNIYFLLYDCVEVLDFTGPFDVFSMANLAVDTLEGKQPSKKCTEQPEHFKLHTVSKTGERETLSC